MAREPAITDDVFYTRLATALTKNINVEILVPTEINRMTRKI